MAGGAIAQVGALERAELGKQAARLLEVVADDLLDLGEPILGSAGEPVRETLVELCAQTFRDSSIGGVADQDVSEPEGGVVGKGRFCGDAEIMLHEPLDCSPDAPFAIGERLHGAPVEDLPLDRAALRGLALRSCEPVEPRSEELLERRGDRGVRVVREHRSQLLDEEGVAARGVAHPRELRLSDTERGREGVDLARRERGEAHDRPRPLRPALEQLRPRQPDQQDASPAVARHVLDQIEQRVLRPVQVVEHDHDTPFLRQPLEHPPGGPGDRLRRGGPVPQPQRQLERCRDRRRPGKRGELLAGLRHRASRRGSRPPSAGSRRGANR